MSAQHPVLDPKQVVAIVGMAGRFPGAADVDALWRLLMARGNAIRPVPAERWDAAAPPDPETAGPNAGGFLDAVDAFDPTFFGISPREAPDIDPQHRLMLEIVWRTLEDAGRAAASLRGSRTGVYVGASWHDYEILRRERGADVTPHSAVGGALDVIAARVSYFLGLTGPSLVVETGCSSSLVALHLACRALVASEVEAAFAGGVNLMLAPETTRALTRFGVLARDGHCKAFAASADGFVRGEGVIAVYLKTLARALADGDRIRGVIAGTAVNNDGGGASLVTPNPVGQEDLLRQAYAGAGVPLDAIAYLEAHGTGTAIGDPIEANAIGRVLGRARSRDRGPLWLGSVKTNIGHLEAAAGLAGLVKAVQALEHRVVPPNLHGDALNPAIAFDELNLRVVREPVALPATGRVFAGVNSFGWGGTNAHAIVCSAPPVDAGSRDVGPLVPLVMPLVVPLSAHDGEALRQRAAELAACIADGGAPLDHVAATLAWRRDQFRRRAAFVAATSVELASQLAAFVRDPDAEIPGVIVGSATPRGKTTFVFAGQGSQWLAMGRELLAASATFAAAIERCAAALAPHVDWDLVACISGQAGDAWATRIDMLQPVLWATSVALAELWREAGIAPDVVVGHSQGEIAAATVAGILSYEDAARVVARRSAIVRAVSGRGLMLAVELDLAGARAALAGFEDRVVVAVHNGPTSCVLSGDADAVAALQELLEAEGTPCRRVPVDYASHSHHMDGCAAELAAALEGLAPRAGATPLVSSTLARQIDGSEMGAAYWMRNLREPVRFAEAMAGVLDGGVSHVIEISPHPVLAPAIEQLAAQRPAPACVLSTLRRGAGSPRDLALSLARAFAAGLAPFGGLRRDVLIPLPGYPWQRGTYGPSARARRTTRTHGRPLALAPAPGEPGAWHGALELARDAEPWLDDHRLHDAIVLPATAMLAIALGAARERSAAPPRMLADVRFLRGVTLGEVPLRASVVWRDDGTGGGSLAFMSLGPGEASWVEHATARFVAAAPAPASAAFPGHLRGQSAIGAEAFYRGCVDRGMHYGPAFQGVASIFVAGDEALGELRLPDACRGSALCDGLHPALWDAALQVCLALCRQPGTLVPTAVTRIVLWREVPPPAAVAWSHVVRRNAARFDVTLFDADARPVMALDGLILDALPVESAAVDRDRLHGLRFFDEPRPAAAPAAGRWAVCGDASDGAGTLADALGGSARLVEGRARSASGWLDALRAGGDPACVVFVAPRAAAGLAAQRRGLLALAGLVQACGALATAPRLIVVTANAQPAVPDDEPDPGAALYWGFTRVVCREHAELQPRIVDVTPADAGWATECAAELVAYDGDDHVALRAGRRRVGRLVRGEAAEGPERRARTWTTPRQPFRLHVARPGDLESLEYRPLRRRAPGPGEIEIEVTAAALNFIDVMKAMGSYPGLDGRSARLGGLGGECAGRVVAVGPGPTALAVGDRAVACAFGSFASHVTVRADHAQAIPGDIEDHAAAGLPLAFTTAWYALHDLARLSAGESVLIHSAAGGLGLAAIQVARRLGARVLATAGTHAKRQYLSAHGIADVFDSRDLSWGDGVRAATDGKGVNVVLNSLTGAALAMGLEVVAEDGRFIEVGKRDIYGGGVLRLAAFKKAISLTAVDLAGLIARRPERFARSFAAAWGHVCSAAFSPLPVTHRRFSEAASALAAMARGEHIGKLVLTGPATVRNIAPEAMLDGRLRGDATYVISGGLGALGMSLAEYMAERGAGALALIARTAPGPDATRRIAALRARGVRVETLALDVADAGAVDHALDRVRRTMPALRGVAHAAGVLDDATIANLAEAQLERVLAPKIDGARHLDAATAGDPLDLFVLFSSAAALFGNAGQAAYAAANAFLDALAAARRRAGRPGLSVQWGPFTDIGLATQSPIRGARLAQHGMDGIAPDEAWAALSHLLERDAPVVGYVPLDLRRWFEAYPETAAQHSWRTLRAAAQGARPVVAGDAFRTQFAASPMQARHALAASKVRELASRVLGLDPKAIEDEIPLKALGLDSLMGLELRNRLETAFGLKLSPTLLWTYNTVHALAGALCERSVGARTS